MCGAGVVGPLFCFQKLPVDVDQLTGELRNRVAQLGFDLVDVRKRGSPHRVRLQIRIDRPDASPGHGVTVDDCAVVSRALEAWFDDDEVFGPQYVLEVSSPGIERPVRFPEHWQRFIGHEVKVRLPERGTVRATIQGVNENHVSLRLENGEEFVSAIEDARDAMLVVDWDHLERSVAQTRPTTKE